MFNYPLARATSCIPTCPVRQKGLTEAATPIARTPGFIWAPYRTTQLETARLSPPLSSTYKAQTNPYLAPASGQRLEKNFSSAPYSAGSGAKEKKKKIKNKKQQPN